MAIHKQILVIGGGPAGIQAAQAAAGAGASVTLISDSPPGGRAAWQTLLPSKMWLNASSSLPSGTEDQHSIPSGPEFIRDLLICYERVAGAWQRQLMTDLERSGVEVMLGTASFISPHEIEVIPPEGGYPDQLSAETIILATGAVPYVPPGLQPDSERIFSPHLVWRMPEVPESLIVIGAGGPATEYVDAFLRLGVRVTWITGPVGALSAFPPEAGSVITRVMARRGVHVVTGLMARGIERTGSGVRVITADHSSHEAQAAFIAIGLRPDLERLRLSNVGLRAGSSGGLATDPFGRTAVEHIYLVGDAASPLSANISMAQGRLVGLHAAGQPVEALRLEYAVMAIYTDPQVAMVGRMSERGGAVQKIRVPFRSSLRAQMVGADSTDGLEFLEIAYDSQRRVVGALAVCPEAAEILTPLALAVRAGLTLDVLANVIPAHPTFSELVVLAARAVK